MLPFVSIALRVKDELHIMDKKGSSMVMKFSKLYKPEKMGEITRTAKEFSWWEKNPTAAFMKAIGIVNKREKDVQAT